LLTRKGNFALVYTVCG